MRALAILMGLFVLASAMNLRSSEVIGGDEYLSSMCRGIE